MKFNKIINTVACGIMALSIANCSSTGTSSNNNDNNDTGSSPQLATVSELPKATGPVTESASANLALTTGDALYLAETGLPLGTTTGQDFNNDSSFAACEMFNMTKEAINNAALGDLILCYIQSSFDAYDEQQESIDIYDGNYHIFALDFTGSNLCGENENEPCDEDQTEDMGPDRIKFKITKGTDGQVTGFEMFACTAGSQEQYLNQTITDTNFSLIGVDSYGGGEFNSLHTVSVTGTLGSNGKFTGTKNITMQFDSTDGLNNDFWGKMVFEQQATSATLKGHMQGSFGNEFGSGTFGNRIYGKVQLLDFNEDDADIYNIGLLALGDGIVKGVATGTFGQESWSDNFLEAWNGDTTRPLENTSDSDYYTDVVNKSVPTYTQPSIAYSASQTWDCSGDVEGTVNFAELNVNFNECAPYSLGHSWTNCWDSAGQPDEDNHIEESELEGEDNFEDDFDVFEDDEGDEDDGEDENE